MRLTALFLSLLLTVSLRAADEPRLLRQKPTLSRTQIVFAYAGDLWSVPRAGGTNPTWPGSRRALIPRRVDSQTLYGFPRASIRRVRPRPDGKTLTDGE